ncbi:hypothetical protein KIPB_015650, partial [Kipferlia bialata]|eukprot:g15650.t1
MGAGTGAILSVLLGQGRVSQVKTLMAHVLLLGLLVGIVEPMIMLPGMEWILL